MTTPVTRRSSEDSLGNRPTTRVRRLICELSVSHMLEVRRRCRLASGKPKTVSPSGMFCSAQVASLGALFSWVLTNSASLASAWA